MYKTGTSQHLIAQHQQASQLFRYFPFEQTTTQLPKPTYSFCQLKDHLKMEQFEFHPSTHSRTFTPLDGPQITQLTLNATPNTHRRTTLQKWEPGAVNTQTHPFVHPYVEEIYIVEGDLEDVRLGQKFEKGCYAYRKPGMEHGPFRSERGCLMFIVCLDADGDREERKEVI